MYYSAAYQREKKRERERYDSQPGETSRRIATTKQQLLGTRQTDTYIIYTCVCVYIVAGPSIYVTQHIYCIEERGYIIRQCLERCIDVLRPSCRNETQ